MCEVDLVCEGVMMCECIVEWVGCFVIGLIVMMCCGCCCIWCCVGG